MFARGLKLDPILKLKLIETTFDFRESNRGNDFETYNKAQKSASAAQLNYGTRCCRCNECANEGGLGLLLQNELAKLSYAMKHYL